MELHFTNLLIVGTAGFASPLVLGLFPRLLLPSVVFELVLGIILGPSVLDWVQVDSPVQVLSLVGLAILLFLSGLEIDFMKLRGRTLRIALLGFAASFLIAILVGLVIAGVEHSKRIRETLLRLQDTTAQIRVRGAFLLMVGLVALATQLGLEVILGAFTAGVILTLVDRDQMMTHPEFRTKLEAVGFGVFIPIFFVTSGVNYDLDALTSSGSTILRVPLFLAALFLVRGLPALILYRPLVPKGKVAVSALLQATSLPFIIAATSIGLELDLITPANGAAVIAAGLFSVLLFPAIALTLLKRDPAMRAGATDSAAAGEPVVVPSM